MNERPASARSLDDPEVSRLVIANAREYAILLMDEGGAIASWSPGAERIFGYSADEVIGRPASVLFVSSDVAANAHEKELDVARKEGKAENSRWHCRKSRERFWGNGVTMRLEDGEPGFLKILRDETATKVADEQRVLLLNELNHRIKNTLTMVQSIAEQTLRHRADPETRITFNDRLMALSQAHDVLVRENWAAADLHVIVEQALAPHRTEGRRFEADGPPVRVSPQQAVALSLALHELCTNAIKYGALSVPSGSVHISWNLALDGQGGRYMNLLWRESGGPPVHEPDSAGFGTRLLARVFSAESGGQARLDYRPEGLQCLLDLPLSKTGEMPSLGMDDAFGLAVGPQV